MTKTNEVIFSFDNQPILIKDKNGIVFSPMAIVLKPTKIIFNNPATIVFWNDGSKTVVKCSEDDIFDTYRGFTMAYLKRIMGSGRKAEKFVDDNFKKVKVFSKEKYYELYPKEIGKCGWAEKCDGLTEKEMNKLRYQCEENWLVEKGCRK